jgi:hypothetical protein
MHRRHVPQPKRASEREGARAGASLRSDPRAAAFAPAPARPGFSVQRDAAALQRQLTAQAAVGPRAKAQRQAIDGPLRGGQRASQSPVVQRYAVVKTKDQKPGFFNGAGAPLRVSDDGSMAVKHVEGTPSNTPDFQTFYATPGIIASSQAALTATGSAFTIAAGGNAMQGRAPGDRHAPQQTLVDAVVTNNDLARIGKGGHTFNACTANLSNFLGVLRGTPGDNTKLDRLRDVELRLSGSLDHDNKSVRIGEDLGQAMVQARQIVTGQDTSGAARDAYNAMKESMRKQIAAQYGIDEGAVPDVGQGFGIIQGGKGGNSGMGHFAPVIAASGADRVTLENDVSQTQGREKQAIGQINPHWYFRMFGPVKEHWWGKEDQTFWGEARKYEKGEYGDRPLVAVLGSQAMQQDRAQD